MLPMPGLRNEPLPFYARFGFTLADEKALKQIWNCFGASGVRCCPLCSNVVNKRTHLRDVDRVVSITCVDVSCLQLHTPETLRNVLQRLAAAQIDGRSGAAYQKLEKLNGWHWHPASLLASPTLGLHGVNQIMFDWNHVYLAKGIFGVEIGRRL